MRLLGMLRTAVIPVASLATVFAACGGSTDATTPLDASSSSGGSSSGSASSSGASSSSSGSTSSASSSGSSSGSDAGDAGFALDPTTLANASCSAAVPDGAPVAPALPQYAGTCPTLAAGGAYTTITTSGVDRKFLVYAPQTVQPNEKLPIVFLWHWLGGDPEDMANVTDVVNTVESRRIIAVIPAPKGDALFRWPFDASATQARIDEELAFFDDMLACVGQALPVNKECVSSMGVSAGALWTAQLASLRNQRLASFVSLSGGTGGVIKSWTPATHAMPGLVLWGGPDDVFPNKNTPLLNFEKASKNLEDALVAENHFLVECIHNCGHAVPPLDPPPPGTPPFDMVWQFVLKHPYWLGAGESPMAKALPTPAFPAWCGVGKGSAVPRAASAPCQ